MLSFHSQFARACRALCTAAALTVLPHGAAWADGDGYDVRISFDPPSGQNLVGEDPQLLITVEGLNSPPALTTTGSVDITLNGNPYGRFPLQDQSVTVPIAEDDQLIAWGSWNLVTAHYNGDGCFNSGDASASYRYYPPSAGQRDAKRRPAASAPRVARGRSHGAARHAQRPTKTKLTPVTSPGQTIDLTAELTDCQDRTVNPMGTVTFLDKDSKPLGNPAPVLLKVAKITISTDQLGPGDNLLTASFKGTNGFGDSSGTAAVTVPPSAKTKAKAVSPPRANRSGPSRDKPRHGMRPQAPPGRGAR